MRTVEFLLQAFDDAWSHKDESLYGVVRGLTPEEASWQHPAYSQEKPMPGLPIPGTILWQLAHLEHSARHYAAILEQRPVKEEPQTPPPEVESLAGLLAELASAQANLRAQIEQLSNQDLVKPCARGMDV
ncbi:MAG: DinB family protein [Balneolaceae bacterium]